MGCYLSVFGEALELENNTDGRLLFFSFFVMFKLKSLSLMINYVHLGREFETQHPWVAILSCENAVWPWVENWYTFKCTFNRWLFTGTKMVVLFCREIYGKLYSQLALRFVLIVCHSSFSSYARQTQVKCSFNSICGIK